MVATKPVDFRKGMDGLAALVKERRRADPFSGVVWVFRARRADRVKLVWWDGTGLCMLTKRLEQGSFRWPRVDDGTTRRSQEGFRGVCASRRAMEIVTFRNPGDKRPRLR
ncbi:MAG TPA: IS66 family insertion sequence element accessory protein TnpB [Caulobacteraceae bacterium]|jgi:transposase